MNGRVLCPLLRPVARAIRWWPLAAGAVLGLSAALVPEALTAKLTTAVLADLVRVAAACAALGAAFLLDDPAARSTPAVPTSRLARDLVRLAVAVPVLAAWWAGLLALANLAWRGPGTPHLPGAALSLEAAALVAVAVALAAAAQRRAVDGNGGIVAAPVLLVLVAGVWFLPARVGLLLPPGDPRWAAAHHRWAVVLGAALLAFLAAGYERTRRVHPARDPGASTEGPQPGGRSPGVVRGRRRRIGEPLAGTRRGDPWRRRGADRPAAAPARRER